MPSKETLEKLIESCKNPKKAWYIPSPAPGIDAKPEEVRPNQWYWVCPYINANIATEVSCPFAERIKTSNKYKCNAKYTKP